MCGRPCTRALSVRCWSRAAKDAVLVVLGRRVGRGPAHLHTGTVAAAVTKHSRAPVRVVPGDWRSGSANPDVVVGLKDPASSPALLTRGLELARQAGGALVVLHAWQVPAGYDDLVPRSQADAWSTALRERILRSTARVRLLFPDVPVQVSVVQDSPVNALCEPSSGLRSARSRSVPSVPSLAPGWIWTSNASRSCCGRCPPGLPTGADGPTTRGRTAVVRPLPAPIASRHLPSDPGA